MSADALKVGVVGGGFIAQDAHIPSLLKCKNARLVAVCDRNGDLAESIARKFRIGRHYVDLAEMLSEEKPDVIDICTSINTHASLSIQAMEAGCHVLVEKPLALTTKEADEMIGASERNKVKLGVVHDMLFSLTTIRMKSMIKEGAIGNLVGVEIRHSFWPQDPCLIDKTNWRHKLPGGILSDPLPHSVYLAREFLGDLEPVVVHTNKIGHLEHLPFDEVRIILEGKNGIATILLSYNSNWPEVVTIDIFATKMDLHANLFNGIIGKYGGNLGHPLRALENLNQSLQILASTLSNGIRVILGKYGGHRLLINEFIQSLQNGAEPPVTAQDGREVVRVMEKITDRMM